MTKKDYELIASSVWRTVRNYEWIEKNKVKREAKLNALHLVATDLSATLAHDNHKFDREKFLTACGIETDPEWAKAKKKADKAFDRFLKQRDDLIG